MPLQVAEHLPPKGQTMPLPEYEQIVQNLRAERAAATPAQIAEGRDWYPTMGILMADLADEAFDATGDPISPEFVAGIVAAFSQNATWKANVTMARRYLGGGGLRGLPSVVREIEAIEAGTDPREAIGHLKRPDFYANLTGDLEPVTCDRWHLRAATGSDKVKLDARVHDLVTRATREVAAEYGEEPATCQAIIWCVQRGDGK